MNFAFQAANLQQPPDALRFPFIYRRGFGFVA
jgi:hypothetical protein